MEEKFTFEDNMAKLSAIVAELTKGEIPLEKAVELYGEGVKLSAVCKKQLSEAQIKITEDGGFAAPDNNYD
jgi:exodeoxyribonuclease VII small subunit